MEVNRTATYIPSEVSRGSHRLCVPTSPLQTFISPQRFSGRWHSSCTSNDMDFGCLSACSDGCRPGESYIVFKLAGRNQIQFISHIWWSVNINGWHEGILPTTSLFCVAHDCLGFPLTKNNPSRPQLPMTVCYRVWSIIQLSFPLRLSQSNIGIGNPLLDYPLNEVANLIFDLRHNAGAVSQVLNYLYRMHDDSVVSKTQSVVSELLIWLILTLRFYIKNLSSIVL